MGRPHSREDARRFLRTAMIVALLLGLLVAGIPSSWAAAPANDSFSSAVTISSLPVTETASNREATLELGEVQPACSTMESTLWYSITPQASGPISVDTFGSDHDTVVAVYTGQSVDSLVEVACNDQSEDVDTGESALTFSASAGTTYHIQAGAWWTPGDLVLNVTGTSDPDPEPTPTPSSTPTVDPSPSVSPDPSPSADPDPSPSPSPSPTEDVPSPWPTGPISTTIHSQKKTVEANGRFMLYGLVLGSTDCARPYTVEVTKYTASGASRSLGSVGTGPFGYWHMYVRSVTSASFSATATGTGHCYQAAAPPTVAVEVRAKVTVDDIRGCSGPSFVHGRVTPAHPGTFVYLQRKGERGWTGIGMDDLNEESRFRVLAPGCGARYRVVWPSQSASNLGGSSEFRFGN